ncbi:hypothetical protein QF032_000024 [Streptomyces achromogenes]|nr:hypothetical protein [Streptomyces achromogenes]
MFCFFLPETKARASAAAGRWPADLDLGGVQTQLDAFGLGIGKYIRQRPKPQAGTVGNRAPPLRQERAHLCDRPGDGGTVDTEQQPQHRVRQVVPQMDQRGHQPVDEHQLMAGAGTRGPLPGPAPRRMATTFDPRLPRLGQLFDQARKMRPREPREQPMRQHRPIDHDRHSEIMPSTWHDTSPAITHQLVRPDACTRTNDPHICRESGRGWHPRPVRSPVRTGKTLLLAFATTGPATDPHACGECDDGQLCPVCATPGVGPSSGEVRTRAGAVVYRRVAWGPWAWAGRDTGCRSRGSRQCSRTGLRTHVWWCRGSWAAS